ncbi:18986_t:CDS:2 [Entrophospora sp. SA101]|nr:18986_t:CDS:2 [Entrophospora sp. SA101]
MGVPSPCHAFCLWGVHCLRAECHINSFGIDRSFREKQEPSPSSHRESHSSRLEVNYFLRKILGILEVHPTILNYHNYLKIKFVKITSRKTAISSTKQVRILTQNNKTLTKLTTEFNTYVIPKTTFIDPNDFITKFKASQAYTSGKSFLQTAQTPKSLLFVPTAPKANVPEGGFLETAISYQRGSSVSHLDQKTYTNTPDFLMRHSLEPGATTDKLIQLGGNYSGGAIGPLLLDIMSSIG